MDSVKLNRSFATRLLFQAQKSPEQEVCGFIGSRDGVACSLYPVRNVAADPARRFDMDPAEQIAVFKTLRERGETLFAIYHSHPSAPPEPSAQDIEGLSYPDALYLIISLNIKGVLEMRGWRRQADGMREVSLTIMD